IFGQHLEETMLYDAHCGSQRLVPALVEKCVCFIREHGLKEEGLFRAPGQTNHVRELQGAFDRGEKLVFDSSTDVHTVASLLKLYIRELPEPIVPFSKYTQFLSCAQILTKDTEMGTLELSKQVKSLPRVNYNLLKYICKFLYEVQSHSDDNKMSVQNLATVFGPNILRPRVEDPVTMMEGSSQVQHLMTVLISEHEGLYRDGEPQSNTRLPPQQSSGQRSKAEWLPQEAGTPPSLSGVHSKTPDHKAEASTPPDSASPMVWTKGEEGQSEGKDRRKKVESLESKAEVGSEGGVEVSPGKQTKAQPTWKTSLMSNAASGGPRAKMGGSAGDVSAGGGNNWLMNGLSSLRAHRRTTSSGERLKDSGVSLKDSTLSLKEAGLKDLQRDSDEDSPKTSLCHTALQQSHRLSAYDNVAPPTLSLPADAATVWTSYEISLAEPQASEREKPQEVLGNKNPPDHSGAEDNPVLTNEDLTKMLTELKQELKKQRSSYEICIRKLEESCSMYQSQVIRLEEDLDQEKKRFRMLEIRLRNSERAHKDAETRNVLLQQEMEEFFKTLGDLTTGATQT
ncbi:unnamed protein product, partial [Tetraodon nigroviridis]